MIRYIIAANLEQARHYARDSGWKERQSGVFINGDIEIRYCTRDCQFRGTKDTIVYLVGQYHLSPIWAATQHWAELGRVKLIYGE